MEMHWFCCECNTTNTSPDDEHLMCSEDTCYHSVCGECFNVKEVGEDGYLTEPVSSEDGYDNDYVVTTSITVNKVIVDFNEMYLDAIKVKNAANRARKKTGRNIKYSKIGVKVLSSWKYMQAKTRRKNVKPRKKDKLRVEAKHMPAVVVPSNTEPASSYSHYYEPEPAYYAEERYYVHDDEDAEERHYGHDDEET